MITRLAITALSPLLTPLRPGNVMMFHIGRCGSTVVADLLHQHQRIYWAAELYAPIFEAWQRDNAGVETVGDMPEDAIDRLRRKMPAALHRYFGVEIKPFHLRLIGHSPESFLDQAERLGFTHFILLDRKNRLRKIISSIIAHEHEALYHIERHTTARLTRVSINPDDVRIDFDAKPLVDYLAGYEQQMNALGALLEGKRTLRLNYEQDLETDPRRAYGRICEFLGLQQGKVSIELSRTNPFPVRDMIDNFDEVREALRGTPYEWMLDD